MAKEEKPKRYVYVKDAELTRAGCSTLEQAIEIKKELLLRYQEPEFRVRNRLRSRTGLWDVLVKRRTEVKDPPRKPTEAERAAARDLDFISQHALTGE